MAFKSLRGTKLEELAKRPRTENERLDHTAAYLAGEGKILGRKPPAVHQLLTPLTLAAGNIVGGAREFRLLGNKESQYFDLQIERREFWRAVRNLKKIARGLQKPQL